ncbi:hypothetical protein B0J11DRAFT_436381 [Dendryphion nanum]|uniref:Uncharacterized protein n=1 Tax=Dendryphion nanum TaxID=256645 RepID=A0A9P9DRC9_9PLEO|nr:hypothetical protein B0J11DRAFT_436381 [Dendryphion nanum]
MFEFIWSQLFFTPPKPTTSFAGKIVIVTGSNVGLGKEAARHITKLGASQVILAVRSIEKGEAAKKDIESTTNVGTDVIKVWQLDMSSYQSVIDFAARVDKELPRLDSAILNAGVARGVWEVFEKDEATITVNVVSTFLLSLLLLPKLKSTAQKFNTRPVLSVVASEVHAWAKFEERHGSSIFERLNDNSGKGDMADRYQVSKLLNILGVRAMTERRPVDKIPVTINTINPGLCHSELSRESGIGLTIIKFFLARTTEVGSRTLVHAGSAGVESHGQYLSNCNVAQPSQFVLSQEGHDTQERYWKELTAKLEAIKPGVTKNL